MLEAWLRHPNMLPLRGGWQATECVLKTPPAKA